MNLLTKIGYKADQIVIIPISGFHGDNLIAKSPRLPWYEGPTLYNALHNLQLPLRSPEKPLRIPIQNVYRISGVGNVAVGKVESGTLKAY